ncbi:dTTP/UTP pyrophosphatase [Brevipalpus obovatus]|uniref:dTTP/UTP pyrophosphatase n=1 Tax=Brevipalpus obovatus TaxID=246614 RepID=UPI003D9F521E
MLQPIAHILGKQNNVLASTSPRRHSLLESIGLKFKVIDSGFNEQLIRDKFSHPCEYVKENAKQKAIHAHKKLLATGDRADLIIGADTVVTFQDQIFEKPKDEEDALNILTKLSGNWHTVFTGVALITYPSSSQATGGDSNQDQNSARMDGDGSGDDFMVTTFHEATEVYICQMTKNIIKSYIETGEPMDKAGAYGIQGIGATLVESIKGDYFNVVGLPLHRLTKELYHLYSE